MSVADKVRLKTVVMPIYAIHKSEPKFIFIINYKVMFSSLSQILPENFSGIKFYHNKADVPQLNFNEYQKFLIARNPYHRAVSAFYGKCRNKPEKSIWKINAQLEYSQHQLLKTIKTIRNQEFEIVRPAIFYSFFTNFKKRALLNENFKILKSISFEEFVACLELILNKKYPDGHFDIQYKAFFIPHLDSSYFGTNGLKNTKIIKLENIDDDWLRLCNHLGKEMTLRKRNQTDHLRPGFEKFYTDKTREMIATLYKIDFEKFGYPTHL